MPRFEITVSHSLCFRQAITTVLLLCLCVLSSPNYVHSVTECDNQDGSCEDITAVDLGAFYVNITIYLICCTADFYYHHPVPVYTNSYIIVDERAIYTSLIHCGGCEIQYNNCIHKLTHKSLVTRLVVYNCYIVSRYTSQNNVHDSKPAMIANYLSKSH